MNSPEFTKLLDGRITTKAPYGMHIGLICKDHPHLGWSTKNIGNGNIDGSDLYIARRIYAHGAECDCSPNLLIVDPKLMEQPDVPT